MMSQKASGEIAELEKSSTGLSNFLYLFDEHWFFYNALKGELAVAKQSLHEGPPPQPPLVVAAAAATEAEIEKTSSSSARQHQLWCCGQEEDTVPRNYSSAFGRKLRYSYSSLDAPAHKSTGRRRPPRTEAPHRRCANPHVVMCWEASNRKAFQNKKWRSLGDLETMELQGFKDLGFVFDESEGVCSSLVSVIPALREKKEEEDKNGEAKRHYLPEGWFTQRSAPPMVLRRVGCCWSGVEMKEQLRFWARAVACNILQGCWVGDGFEHHMSS